MSFKQQAALADRLIKDRDRSSASQVSAKDRGIQCGAVDRELNESAAATPADNMFPLIR